MIMRECNNLFCVTALQAAWASSGDWCSHPSWLLSSPWQRCARVDSVLVQLAQQTEPGFFNGEARELTASAFNSSHNFICSHTPKGGRGCLMSPSCLESRGCHLIPLSYLLSCFFCLVLLLFLVLSFFCWWSILLTFFSRKLKYFLKG